MNTYLQDSDAVNLPCHWQLPNSLPVLLYKHTGVCPWLKGYVHSYLDQKL